MTNTVRPSGLTAAPWALPVREVPSRSTRGWPAAPCRGKVASQKIIDLIHVEFDYYDISDELLGKKEFAEIVENYDLQVRDYQDGYENEKQMALIEQLD